MTCPQHPTYQQFPLRSYLSTSSHCVIPRLSVINCKVPRLSHLAITKEIITVGEKYYFNNLKIGRFGYVTQFANTNIER
jgi:hypothetical protein